MGHLTCLLGHPIATGAMACEQGHEPAPAPAPAREAEPEPAPAPAPELARARGIAVLVGRGAAYFPPPGPFLVGRARQSAAQHLLYEYLTVSRTHLWVEWSGDTLVVTDVSQFGTTHDDAPLPRNQPWHAPSVPVVLRLGDRCDVMIDRHGSAP